MGNVLLVNTEKCTGCRLCELACSFKHHGEYNPIKSRISVFDFPREAMFVPVFCMQCRVPWCVKVCKADAIRGEETDGTWVIKVDEEKCVGCKMCVKSCPFGCLSFVDSGKYVQKCDLCGGEPECVKFCIQKALEFKQAEVVTSSKKKETARKVAESYKEADA